MQQIEFELIAGSRDLCSVGAREEGNAAIPLRNKIATDGIAVGTELPDRISYGLSVIVTGTGGEKERTSYPDISLSKQAVEDFIDMLRRNSVSPIHVEEMIDDFFYAW